jgi:hypothetical protein
MKCSPFGVKAGLVHFRWRSLAWKGGQIFFEHGLKLMRSRPMSFSTESEQDP